MDYGWGEKRKKEKETETGERHACILKQGRYRIRRFCPTLTDQAMGHTVGQQRQCERLTRLLKNKQHSEALKETHTDPLTPTLVLCWQEKCQNTV